MAKIVHLSSVHPAYDVRIFHKECMSLAKAGHEVVLIIQNEKDEVKDGVRIRALPRPKSRMHRMLWQGLRVFIWAMQEKADIYHFHDPELLPYGVLLRLLGKKVIYDSHEDAPRSVFHKDYLSKPVQYFLYFAVRKLEVFSTLFFTRVVAATPRIAKNFPHKKTVIVQNFPIVRGLAEKSADTDADTAPHFIYVGSIDRARGGRELMEALVLLNQRHRARLQLIGVFSPPGFLDELKAMRGWDYVDFLGYQNPRKVAELLQNAVAGLCILHPVPNYVESQPTKLYEYMIAGIPFIASDFPLICQFVKQVECGHVVDPLDPVSIAAAMEYFLVHPEKAKMMGQAGKKVVFEKLNWAAEEKTLLEMYQQLLN